RVCDVSGEKIFFPRPPPPPELLSEILTCIVPPYNEMGSPPLAGSEPDCNCCCCLSNKYTYMQLRSPEVTRVNFHLSDHQYFSLPTLRVCSQQSIVPKSFRCNVQG